MIEEQRELDFTQRHDDEVTELIDYLDSDDTSANMELLRIQMEHIERQQRVFGDESYMVQVGSEMNRATEPEMSMEGHWGYEIFILFMALLYLVWGSRRLSIKVGGFFRGESHTLDGSGGARVGQNINASNGIVGGGGGNAEIVNAALSWSLVLGAIILLLSKGAELAMSEGGVPFLGAEFTIVGRFIGQMGLGLWMAAVMGIFCATTLWFVLVVWCSDWLARSRWLYGAVLELRSDVMVWCSVAMLPLLILGALDYGSTLLFYISIGFVALMCIYYIMRSFLLFAKQKVSLLHWFLYLCAVEIFPLTLLWKLLVDRW